MGKILGAMNDRLSDNEKDYFIKCAKSRVAKEILIDKWKRSEV
jgi:hypothetical protein